MEQNMQNRIIHLVHPGEEGITLRETVRRTNANGLRLLSNPIVEQIFTGQGPSKIDRILPFGNEKFRTGMFLAYTFQRTAFGDVAVSDGRDSYLRTFDFNSGETYLLPVTRGILHYKGIVLGFNHNVIFEEPTIKVHDLGNSTWRISYDLIGINFQSTELPNR